MTTYISKTDTAKLIRKALKENFPSITFSVRGNRGSSIDVEWTDGANEEAVKQVVKQFEGATFDAMQDLRETRTAVVNGQSIRYGADFVFTQRLYSVEFMQKIATYVVERYHFSEAPVYEVKPGYKCAWVDATLDSQHSGHITFIDLVRKTSYATDAANMPKLSAPVSKDDASPIVKYLRSVNWTR